MESADEIEEQNSLVLFDESGSIVRIATPSI